MQQKNHRSISSLLFWKCFLLICLPLWTLPTLFFKLKNVWKIKNVKKVKNVTKIKKNVKTFLHLWSISCISVPAWAIAANIAAVASPLGDIARLLHDTANRHLLAVPRFRLNTYSRRAFSVAGPMAWNSLPYFIRDPTSSTDCFKRLVKTYLFARY